MRYDQVYAFLQLGLSPGADEQAIKRAYAQKIKNCNPETDAENAKKVNPDLLFYSRRAILLSHLRM